jgi:hypothetical protein
LFGALANLPDGSDWERVARGLKAFIEAVNNENTRIGNDAANKYYEATRSASNDAGPRKLRIDILRRIIEEGVQ